ncbi:unnamed protein product [Staurois parvus]|uniref:Prostaglandin E2 receptor EP3 subtype n=1 Tax=Staurois parvus TaxID=386267 RepID=A0ABN9DT94_9NEOB|nr:unnamed protein product [Staurois parvus]
MPWPCPSSTDPTGRRRVRGSTRSCCVSAAWRSPTSPGSCSPAPSSSPSTLAGRQWNRVDPSGHLCNFFGLSMAMFGLCPLFIASAMAIERTLAIRSPHWYSSHMRSRATVTVLLAIWGAGLGFALLPLLGLGHYSVQWPGTWCFISTDQRSPGNVVFAATFASLGLLSLGTTFTCNLATIKALVSRCKSRSSASKASKQWERITMETMFQLMGIMCVLFACWSPLLVGGSWGFRAFPNLLLFPYNIMATFIGLSSPC